MDIESFSYVVVAALIGMCVVFIFLWALSVLMRCIKSVFGERNQSTGGEHTVRSSSKDKRVAAFDSQSSGIPIWVSAAVAVFVLEDEYRCSAQSWIPRPEEANVPWILFPMN